MRKIIIHHSVIISIDKIRLIYTDFEGNQAQIRFDECRKNWVNYANSSTEFEKPDLKEEETCCVGWRDAFDKTPYIEFFTEPRARFVFPYKRTFYEWFRKLHSRKGYKYFRATCNELEAHGWSTFDLG
jgi:hypothetical protein